MVRKRISKNYISIQEIGKERFWIGTFTGLFSAIIISLAFSQSREAYRIVASMFGDLMVLPENELLFFNYFYSFLASVLGLSVAIWIWMSNFKHSRRRDRLKKQLAKTNAIFVFWLVLMGVVRFGSIISMTLYGRMGYDNHLDLFHDYWILFVLIPLVVFTQSWYSVRLVYRAGKWIVFSFVFSILLSIAFYYTTTVDQERYNNVYFKRYEKDYNYINKEVNKAILEYGIEFNPRTISVLKKWHTESSLSQIEEVKKSFSRKSRVSIDTIILQKIIVRNFKEGHRDYRRRDLIDRWQYALPNDILRQIGYFNINSNETKELIALLKEQIDLANTPRYSSKDTRKLTETERRKSFYARFKASSVLVEQLRQVRDSLINDDRFFELNKALPEIQGR